MRQGIGKILGPPGTGKTTEIMRLVEAAAQKYNPDNVGVVSFTRAAMNEVRDRIKNAASGTSKVAKNVRTLHSHCFKLLEMKRDYVAESKIKSFNDYAPEFALDDTSENTDESANPYECDKINKQYFQQMQVLRNRLVPEDDWPPGPKAFWAKWRSWMNSEHLLDFTGMLEEVQHRELAPDIDILFVDEAQDLTPLQYAVTRRWSQNVSFTIYAGDSDQSIFRFQGAIPEVFRDLENSWSKNLHESYRVSPKIRNYSSAIIRQARNREESEYNPTQKYGEGKVFQTPLPDLSLGGSHMLISRCNYQVNSWIKWLYANGHLWHNPYRESDLYWNPTNTKTWRAAENYCRLVSGDPLRPKEFLTVVHSMKAKGNIYHGGKTKVLQSPPSHDVDIFDLYALGFADQFIDGKIPLKEVIDLKGLSGEILATMKKEAIRTTRPNVIVGTVHSVKGGEADHVWFDSGVSPLIYKSIIHGKPEIAYDEARVAYVAVTRARKTLGILTSRSWNPLLPRRFE